MIRHWAAFARIAAAAALLAAFTAIGASAEEPRFPAFTGYVVDDAGVLNAATRTRLTDALGAFHRASKRQVVVATVRSLQGLPIEDYGYRLGRAWGVGERGKDTGAVLLVAPNERQVRIEVGYGLEGELTDARSKQIIEQIILPSFRGGDLNGGVVAGTAAILRVLGAPATALDQGRAAQGVTGGDPGQLWGFLIPLLIFGLFAFLRSHSYVRRGYGTPIIWGRGFGGGGFGGGGFGGGGGGSFGGGGASGRW